MSFIKRNSKMVTLKNVEVILATQVKGINLLWKRMKKSRVSAKLLVKALAMESERTRMMRMMKRRPKLPGREKRINSSRSSISWSKHSKRIPLLDKTLLLLHRKLLMKQESLVSQMRKLKGLPKMQSYMPLVNISPKLLGKTKQSKMLSRSETSSLKRRMKRAEFSQKR